LRTAFNPAARSLDGPIDTLPNPPPFDRIRHRTARGQEDRESEGRYRDVKEKAKVIAHSPSTRCARSG